MRRWRRAKPARSRGPSSGRISRGGRTTADVCWSLSARIALEMGVLQAEAQRTWAQWALEQLDAADPDPSR